MGQRPWRRRSGRRDPLLTTAIPRVGIGGWDYAPWRGRFYPPGLPRAAELGYAAARLTAIEVNATFYRTQSRESFARWRAAVPPDFMFSLKAPRAASYARDPAQIAAAVARFLDSGITALGPMLGPILWQFPPTRRFDAAAVAAFVALLPPAHEGLALRHAIEAKHPSFADPAYTAMLTAACVADCIFETAAQPARMVPTTDFLYLRLQRTHADATEGYDSTELNEWTAWLRAKMASMSRGIHVYFISGAKERAPDAAMALLRRFGSKAGAVLDRNVRQA